MAGRSVTVVVLLLCVVVASLLISFAEAACPNNCNNHGRCNPNNLCDCDDGWVGPGCTLNAQALNPGTTLNNQLVPARGWNYYYTKDMANHSWNMKFVWWVNTTATSGDIDIFVQKDRLPTRVDYIARNITTMPYFTVTAPRSGSGTFYIGVYGFSGRSSTYKIGLQAESECPNACSGHGSCQSGVCVCVPDFTGPACDNAIKQLTINRPVAASVKSGEWKYFRIHAIVENTLRVIVNQTSSTGSVDLYAKYNKVPTLTDYDLSEQSLAKNFYMDIQLQRSTFGYWNLGIYGLSDCSFSIKYQQYNDCPNDCSSHGTCATNGCRCNSGFVGSYCETMVAELADGQIIKGFVGDNTWNYYTYTPHSTTEMLISVNQTGNVVGQDCDVYVRKGFKPTLSNWDARNISLAQKMIVRVPEPEFTVWHIGVFGFRACTYFISASSTSKCNQCGPHGQCGAQEGVCICDAGWAGQNCDIQIQAITNFSAPIVANLAQGQWNYYSIQGLPNREVTVHMIEMQTVGYFWLFLNQKTIPTLTNFNSTLSDKESNTNHHQVRTDTTNNDIWYIGVYGSPFSADDKKPYPYELQAWESPF